MGDFNPLEIALIYLREDYFANALTMPSLHFHPIGNS